MSETQFFVKLSMAVRDDGILQKLHGCGGATYAVWIALGLHVGTRGTCFPSYHRLCHLTGYGRSTVALALKRLEELDLISIAPRYKEGTDPSKRYRTSNLYNMRGLFSFGQDKTREPEQSEDQLPSDDVADPLPPLHTVPGGSAHV